MPGMIANHFRYYQVQTLIIVSYWLGNTNGQV